ncbi:MAG: hypothetical protein HWN65_00640 [Candidatus Helarchaeota archaeon]|nr:hypothetical protein [Candidatus Helarchaeota archaeon]
MQSRLLEGHNKGVRTLAWAPEGKLLASASSDNTIRIWERDGECLKVLEGHKKEVHFLAWAPDGELLVSVESGREGSDDVPAVVWLWHRNGEPKTWFKTSPVRALAWTPNGEYFATGSVDNAIRLWDRNGKLIKVLREHEGTVYSLAWAPESGLLVSSRGEGEILFWDKDWNFTREYQKGMKGSITRIKWSPNGEFLASFGGGRIALWSKEGKPLRALTFEEKHAHAHTEDIIDIKWSPDSTLLASASWDRTILIWDTNGKCLKMIQVADLRSGSQFFSVPRSISWSSDGKTIASTFNDGTLRFWNREWECIGTGKLNFIRKTRISVTPLAIFREEDTGDYDDKALWSPKGNALAAWERKNNRIIIFNWVTTISGEFAIKTPEKIKISEKSKKTKSCTICFQEFLTVDELSECHYCGTVYHSKCILKWVLEEGRVICPECNNLFIIVV